MRKLLKRLLILIVALAGVSTYVLYPPDPKRIEFPGGKRFALSIVDDTDLTFLERVAPLYDLLYRSGLRTTKTVWTLPTNYEAHSANQGHTLRDLAYRAFIMDLHKKGFEIAMHGVRGGSSPREDTINGLEEFNKEFGRYPSLHVNHAINRDNLYWGEYRWSIPVYRWGFGLASPFEFSGHEPNSPYFWGDVAKQRIRYVRRFTYRDINVLAVNPTMPYRLADMPFVNYWFDSADGGNLDAFEALLKPANLDRLEREGGVCLIYAHLGAGSFNRGNDVEPRFAARIKELASRNGWFAPASEILDHLVRQPGWSPELSLRDRVRLETLYLRERLY